MKIKNYWVPVVLIVGVVAVAIVAGGRGALFKGAFNVGGFGVRNCRLEEVMAYVSPSIPTTPIDVAKSKELVGLWTVKTPYDCQYLISSMELTWRANHFELESFHANLKNPYITPSSGFPYRFTGSSTCVNEGATNIQFRPISGPIYVRGSQSFALWSGFTLDRGAGVDAPIPFYSPYWLYFNNYQGGYGVPPARNFVSGGVSINPASVQDTCR